MATTGTSFSYLSTATNRMSGLSSGMDIDSIVEKLMKAESAKMEKLQQQKQKYEWQRDAYRSVNTKLEAFRNEAFDSYGLQRSFSVKTVSVSDSSKIDATATASAVGSLTISTGATLATSAKKVSNNIQTMAVNMSHKLSDFGIAGDANGVGSFEIQVGGVDKIINFSKDDSLENFLGKLTAAGVTGATLTTDGKISLGSGGPYSLDTVGTDTTGRDLFTSLGFDTSSNSVNGIQSVTKTLKANSSSKLSDIGIAADGYITLNVLQADGTMKETSVQYKQTDTISSFVSNLNSSGAGVTAVFNNGEISITANATGNAAGGAIQIIKSTDNTKTDDGGVFQKLNLMDTSTGFLANGTNAVYTVNGVTKESATNNISEFGYSITLKQANSGAVVVSSTTDVNAMVDKVKSFIDLYNGLVESLNSPITEKKVTNYQPLTDAQKAGMTTDQITLWETQAKKGLLKSDSVIRNVLSNMREAVYDINESTTSSYNSLFNVGITTTKTYNDGGKIEISNETRLREAIANDPEAVMNLFTDANTGLIAKLRKVAKEGIDQIAEKAGKVTSVDDTYTLGQNIISLNTRISDWKDKLKSIEERYYKQFSAMETAIQKANSQSSIFSQG